MNHKENSIQFWNQFFKENEPITISKEEVKVENTLDQYLKHIGDTCEHVLDVGCGMGTTLIGSMCLGNHMKEGIGFDASQNAIDFANKTIKQSNISNLSFHVSDESFLLTLDNDYFDGMICSNFLDVIPRDLSDWIIEEMKRILKPNGLLLLKINFLLDASLVDRLKMELIDENTYQLNGTIRSYNLSTDAWIKRFDGFDVVKVDGYKRAEHLPEDRIILLRKR